MDLPLTLYLLPYLTARPASLSAFAVPPEATRLKPRDARFLANSTRPVLSDTLNRAETEDISHYSRAFALRSPGSGEEHATAGPALVHTVCRPGQGAFPARPERAAQGVAGLGQAGAGHAPRGPHRAGREPWLQCRVSEKEAGQATCVRRESGHQGSGSGRRGVLTPRNPRPRPTLPRPAKLKPGARGAAGRGCS